MRHYTILLIDYEPRSIERVRRPLAEAGFLVRLATDGLSGVSLFEELNPDLVIIEAMIPKKHGFEVCQEIKRTAHGKRTPVFVQTAVYKGRKYRSQALHIYNCDEYLEKPYSDEFLVETVRSRLGIAPGEPVGVPETPVPLDEPEPAIEVVGPDRPVRRREPRLGAVVSGSPIPRDPDHPAEEEISQRLDDLFAMGDDEPRAVGRHAGNEDSSPATARQASGARTAAALAMLPEDPVPPGDPAGEGEATGELVDFETHRAHKRHKKKGRPDGVEPAVPAPPPVVLPQPQPRRGLPQWVWAGLVGTVAVLCYLIFSGTI